MSPEGFLPGVARDLEGKKKIPRSVHITVIYIEEHTENFVTGQNSNHHLRPIRFPASHGLAGLLDCRQHGIVGKSRVGGNVGRLSVKADIKGLDP